MSSEYPDLLKGLTPADMAAVLALGTRTQVAGGKELFHLGAPAASLFLIQRGRLKLTLPMQVRGNEENVMVEERGPGQTVGWSALTPPHRFTLTASALLDTEVIALDREKLLAHFESCPQVGYTVSLNLASLIGQRLQLFQAMWVREMQRMVEVRYA
jgi:CRP-like cAMP-binding protein